MRAEFPRLVRLCLAGSEGRHLAAPFIEKLHSHVPQPADPDHAHTVRWLHSEIGDRSEHRDAPAEKRTRTSRIKFLRQFDRPLPIRAHPVREATVAAYDHLLALRAEIVMP